MLQCTKVAALIMPSCTLPVHAQNEKGAVCPQIHVIVLSSGSVVLVYKQLQLHDIYMGLASKSASTCKEAHAACALQAPS